MIEVVHWIIKWEVGVIDLTTSKKRRTRSAVHDIQETLRQLFVPTEQDKSVI